MIGLSSSRKVRRLHMILFCIVVGFILTGCSLMPIVPKKSSDPVRTDLLGSDFLERLVTSPTERAKVSIVPVQGEPFTQAIRVENLLEVEQSYHIQVTARTVEPIKAGDLLALTFYVRGIETDAADGKVTIGYVVEQRSAPQTKLVLETISVPADETWTRVDVPVISHLSLEPNNAQVAFRFGYNMQTVEVGGIKLTSFGKL